MTAETAVTIPETAAAAVEAALAWLPPPMRSDEARVMLYAIGLQESRLRVRAQVVAGRPGAKGPARGLWQFEKMGGTAGVIRHPATKGLAGDAVRARGVWNETHHIWMALEKDDTFAAIFARLLLWTDPAPLPALGSRREAWEYYLRVWRPGKPKPATWDAYYETALDFVRSRTPAAPPGQKDEVMTPEPTDPSRALPGGEEPNPANALPPNPASPSVAASSTEPPPPRLGLAPAFPARHGDLAPDERGATLRDLAAFLVAGNSVADIAPFGEDYVATRAYRLADALMRARQGGPK